MIRNRAIWIGLLLSMLLAFLISYSGLLGIPWTGVSWLAFSYMPPGAIFLLFLLVMVNVLLKRFKLSFNPAELLFIYAMMILSGMVFVDFLSKAIFMIAGPFYYATETNQFAQVQQIFPKWLLPGNPQDLIYFYEGLPQNHPVPYGDWIRPLFYLGVIFFGILLVMFSLSVILRKQWVDTERLAFPLTYLPVEMVTEKENEPGFPPLFRSKIMWGFFIVPVVYYFLKNMHLYIPVIPDVPFHVEFHKFFAEKPWNAIQSYAFFKIIFCVIAFAYFIPASISFSMWFFFIFFLFQMLVGSVMGLPVSNMTGVGGWGGMVAFRSYQIAGAIIGFAAILLWSTRQHLKDVFLKAIGRGSGIDDSEEGAPYAFAFWGLIAGVLIICFWGMAAGISFWKIFLWTLFLICMVITIARVVAEGGLYFVVFGFEPFAMLLPFTGTVGLGSSMPMLFLTGDMCTYTMQSSFLTFSLSNFKIADAAKINKRKLSLGMALSLTASFLIAAFMILTMAYRKGAVNLPWVLVDFVPKQDAKLVISYLYSPISANIKSIFTMLGGSAVTVFLFMMMRTFLWWPLHPLGYIVGLSLGMQRIWFCTFLGWLINVFVKKTFGIGVYQKLKIGFIGLILGEFVSWGFWAIISLFTRAFAY